MKDTKKLFIIILCLIILVFAGCSKNTEDSAQETAKDFVMDLYTVNDIEIENYKSLLSLNPLEAMDLYDEVQINDEVLKSLMTDNAYERMLKNRENLKFTEICYRKNYTMQASEIKLAELNTNTEASEAVYNFEVQINLISGDGNESASIAKGTIELAKIDNSWKVAGYRYILPDLLRDL